MAKKGERFSQGDDEFIVAHYEAVGSMIGPWDLGRSQASIIRRAAFLRKAGGWAAIEAIWAAQYTYRRLVDKRFKDEDDRNIAAEAELEAMELSDG